MSRYRAKGNVIIEADSIEEIKVNYLDGNFYGCPIHPEVYYMQDGKRRWVKTFEVWEKMSADLGVVWGDIKILSVPEWDEFLSIVEEGKIIEEWPEGEYENHHTDEVIAMLHTASGKQSWIPDYVKAGFNVVHSNDTMNFSPSELVSWLDAYKKHGILGYPRIREGNEDVLRAIAKHPALFGATPWDERDCEHISLQSQRDFYELANKYGVPVWGLWDQEIGEWPAGVINYSNDVADGVLVSCYIFRKEYPNGDWNQMQRFIDRIKRVVIPTMPLIIVGQAFYWKGDPHPKIEPQFEFCRERLEINSFALYLWRGDEKATGMSEDAELLKEVTAFNKKLRGI